MIEIENLSKRYGETLAAGGLDLLVRPGVVTGFLGPNGAGQPVTMRMIAGLDELGLLLEATAVHTGRPARRSLSPFRGPAAATD